MNKVLSVLLLALIATIISACFMLPSLSAEMTERKANEVIITAQLKERQANEVIFQQSTRIVTLEGRLTKAMEAAQQNVYAIERREKLLEETALKLQTAMIDLAKSESSLDAKICEIKLVKEELVKARLDLVSAKRTKSKLSKKVQELTRQITVLQKKFSELEPTPN